MPEFSTRPLLEHLCSISTTKIVDLSDDAGALYVAQAGETAVQVNPVGRTLASRYVVRSLLGRGGMGAVYKALDLYRADLPEARRFVAIKILNQNVVGRPTHIASLRREFYCAQALAHPSIIQVYETDSDRELAFFTMELLTGELLSAAISRVRPASLPRPYAWAVIRDIGAGLVHAHSRHVVHGDLKPQNVMITADNEIRILDFGSSGARTRRLCHGDLLQRDPVPEATPRYTCCELLEGQQSDARDDLFAFACITYELLTGRHPFEGCDASEARERGIAPKWPSGLTLWQWRTLRQGLAWHRDGRSIEVRDWLVNLGVPVAPSQLPPISTVSVTRTPALRRSQPLLTPTARRAMLCVALIAALGLALAEGFASWRAEIVMDQPSPPAQIMGGGEAPQNTDVDPLPVAVVPAVMRYALPGGPAWPTAPAITLSPRAQHRAITISAGPLRVAPDARFAEITVIRSAAVGVTSFTWWTEGSTAQSSRDFVPQMPTTQTFSKGRRSMKLYVRLLRNPSRQHEELLYVAIGEPGDGLPTHFLARTPIWIPAQAGEFVASN